VKPLRKAIGLIDRVRDMLDEDFYQDGLYEEDPAEGIRYPLHTQGQREATQQRMMLDVDDLLPVALRSSVRVDPGDAGHDGHHSPRLQFNRFLGLYRAGSDWA